MNVRVEEHSKTLCESSGYQDQYDLLIDLRDRTRSTCSHIDKQRSGTLTPRLMFSRAGQNDKPAVALVCTQSYR